MKKVFLAILFASISLSMFSQDLIKHNYKFNGYTYIGSERIKVDAGDKHPFLVSLEYIKFPEGTGVDAADSVAFILEMNYISSTSRNATKGSSFTATTAKGRVINSQQIHTEANDKSSFPDAKGKPIYWNTVKYLLDEGSIQEMAKGVKNTDVAFSFSPDDYISTNYENDEFGKAVKELYYAIRSEKEPKRELGGNIKDYSDQESSISVLTKGFEANGAKNKYAISMIYMYFKEEHGEAYDLNFKIIGNKNLFIPFESSIVFTLEDGSKIELKQQRDAQNTIFLYPEVDQIKRLMKGNITQIDITHQNGKYTDIMRDNSFSDIIGILYNSLQMVAVL